MAHWHFLRQQYGDELQAAQHGLGYTCRKGLKPETWVWTISFFKWTDFFEVILLTGRNPVNSPVEVGRLSHYLRRVLAPSKRWFSRRISEPSTVTGYRSWFLEWKLEWFKLLIALKSVPITPFTSCPTDGKMVPGSRTPNGFQNFLQEFREFLGAHFFDVIFGTVWSLIGSACRGQGIPKENSSSTRGDQTEESPNQDSWCMLKTEDFSIYGVFDGHGQKGRTSWSSSVQCGVGGEGV